MNKPKVGQWLYTYDRVRNWGGSGYVISWKMLEVVRVGRKYFYTRQLGWTTENRHGIESYISGYLPIFSSSQEARHYFLVEQGRIVLRKAGVDLSYPLKFTEDLVQDLCRVLGLEKELEQALDEKLEPMLELEKQQKAENLTHE